MPKDPIESSYSCPSCSGPTLGEELDEDLARPPAVDAVRVCIECGEWCRPGAGGALQSVSEKEIHALDEGTWKRLTSIGAQMQEVRKFAAELGRGAEGKRRAKGSALEDLMLYAFYRVVSAEPGDPKMLAKFREDEHMTGIVFMKLASILNEMKPAERKRFLEENPKWRYWLTAAAEGTARTRPDLLEEYGWDALRAMMKAGL